MLTIQKVKRAESLQLNTTNAVKMGCRSSINEAARLLGIPQQRLSTWKISAPSLLKHLKMRFVHETA